VPSTTDTQYSADGFSTAATFSFPISLATDDATLYVTEIRPFTSGSSNRLSLYPLGIFRAINLSTGYVSTIPSPPISSPSVVGSPYILTPYSSTLAEGSLIFSTPSTPGLSSVLTSFPAQNSLLLSLNLTSGSLAVFAGSTSPLITSVYTAPPLAVNRSAFSTGIVGLTQPGYLGLAGPVLFSDGLIYYADGQYPSQIRVVTPGSFVHNFCGADAFSSSCTQASCSMLDGLCSIAVMARISNMMCVAVPLTFLPLILLLFFDFCRSHTGLSLSLSLFLSFSPSLSLSHTELLSLEGSPQCFFWTQ
jgi:hypothetical protein